MERAAARASRVAVLTRPAGRNEALADRLRAAGWTPCVLPALAIHALPVAADDLPRPADHDMVVFVSGNAARQYLDQLARIGACTAWPRQVVVATVGPASAAGLREMPGFGANTTVLHPGDEAASHDSEALWEVLRGLPRLPARVLLVRGTQGRDWLGDKLAGHGVVVTRHAAYARSPAQWDESELSRLRRWAAEGVFPTWLITSGEGADAVRATAGRGAGRLVAALPLRPDPSLARRPRARTGRWSRAAGNGKNLHAQRRVDFPGFCCCLIRCFGLTPNTIAS